MKQFRISEELANRVLNYLAERPWREVNDMVGGLLGLEEVTQEPGENPQAEENGEAQ